MKHTVWHIYLDYNSFTPIDPRVLESFLLFLQDNFANPRSTHHFGKRINEKVKQAREQIANFSNAEPKELFFSSGVTEPIIISIKELAVSFSIKGKHIITVSTEYKTILDTCKDLERKGFEVAYLPVQSNDLIDIGELKKFILTDTILVSVIFVNNETGDIQAIKEIANLVHEKGALFITDANQAVGIMEIDVDDLGIDLLCFSGHKMYAPKGIGALFVRQRENKVKLALQIHGVDHEQGTRSGTLNVPGIIALAKACEIISEEMALNQKNISALRDKLETELLKLPNASLNGDSDDRVYNTTNTCLKGQDAYILIGRMKDIAVSNNSACFSAVVEPSHVLTSMGLSDDDTFASLKFSLGKFNTLEYVETVINRIKELAQPNLNYA